MGLEEESKQEEEFEASFRRAFVEEGADYLEVDGHTLRNKFLRESLQYGVNKGWLQRGEDMDEDDILGPGMGQSLAYTYRLTDEGKRHFGIKR